MTPSREPFKGEIRVASRIVDYLSSGLYNSAAACLKELVNNSYDADATRVEVFVKPDSERIIVADDGVGMSYAEFKQHFERVSESHKRDGGDETNSGRPKVGKIGIGFIAANELCDVMEIASTKKGSTELLKVEINFIEMRQPPEKRKRNGSDYLKADYEGHMETALAGEHYTRVVLKQVRDTARGILAGARDSREHTHGELSVYGRKPGRIRGLISDATDWSDFDEYSQTILQVGLNVPVRYLPSWYPGEHKKILGRFEREVAKLGFEVYCDGSDIRKPVVLDAGEANLLRSVKIEGEYVSARGYFYAKRKALRPQWLNGVLIRIRNAAVGEYDATFMGFKATEGRLFQSWISCELWADNRLEDALNIDRRTLRVTHPAFVELQERFHLEFSDFLGEVRETLYSQPAAKRRKSEARAEIERFAAVIDSPKTALSPKVRQKLAGRAQRRTETGKITSQRDVRAVLRKYGVTELYELALDVARETLSPEQYQKFAQALAERLLR